MLNKEESLMIAIEDRNRCPSSSASMANVRPVRRTSEAGRLNRINHPKHKRIAQERLGEAKQ
jgi:hypothetical protein